MKVLIIDDEEDFRVVASTCLGLLSGDDVREAGSGAEGLTMAAEDVPDVILLDLMMPNMDGQETLANLRQNSKTLDVPVIFCTTKGMFDGFEEMRKLGALGVITKPFDPERLSDQIKKILRTAGKLKEPALSDE
jgi:two-component system OmpR family response regulator